MRIWTDASKRKRIGLLLILAAITGFLLGDMTPPATRPILSRVKRSIIGNSEPERNESLELVAIPSSADGSQQMAYFHPARDLAPLVVVLHSWGGSYKSPDKAADVAIDAGWNYIHPDFRGPNIRPEACLSDLVIADIDDAISYAIEHGNVDTDQIHVLGGSGGGLAAIGTYLRSNQQLKSIQAWVPITDLEQWYYQSRQRGTDHAGEILLCTSNGGELNIDECRARSPMYWDLPDNPPGRIEIFAGIHDGHDGSVPISHSLLFWNRLCNLYESTDSAVTDAESIDLLSRAIPASDELGTIGGRRIFFSRVAPFGRLTIFDGGHETLKQAGMRRLIDE